MPEAEDLFSYFFPRGTTQKQAAASRLRGGADEAGMARRMRKRRRKRRIRSLKVFSSLWDPETSHNGRLSRCPGVPPPPRVRARLMSFLRSGFHHALSPPFSPCPRPRQPQATPPLRSMPKKRPPRKPEAKINKAEEKVTQWQPVHFLESLPAVSRRR